MATKEPLPVESIDEAICHEITNKAEFVQLQKRLKIFHDITNAIGNIFDIDALLEEIIKIIFTVFPPCRSLFCSFAGF